MKTWLAVAFFAGLTAGMFINALPLIADTLDAFTKCDWEVMQLPGNRSGLACHVKFSLHQALIVREHHDGQWR